jgi:iron-sulfur cluster repair protein YtfE (RIC family)
MLIFRKSVASILLNTFIKGSPLFLRTDDTNRRHATIEEEIFYPAVKKARSEHVKDEVREGYEEHRQIKSLLAQISNITPADETYDMKLKVLKEDVEHHVKDEEGEMFPDAKKFLDESRLVELGTQLEARKQQLEAPIVPKSELDNQRTPHIPE